MLKADAENLFTIYSLSLGRFSSVGSHGSEGTSSGGRERLGQLHVSSPGEETPLFEQGGGGSDGDMVAARSGGGQLPIVGKLGGNVCSCSQQSLERYVCVTLSDT